MNDRLVSISEAAELLGVCIKTLRNWDKDGSFVPIRTVGNHRRYFLSKILLFQGISVPAQKQEVITYARVSSQDQKQKGDLDRQNERLETYCKEKSYKVIENILEVGSGMSGKRPRLNRLFSLAEKRQISKVIVENKDRLTRFNFEVYKRFFESHGVSVEIVNDIKPKSYQEELVADMISILASFSSKIYGRRSHENKKKASTSCIPIIT